MIFQTLLTNLLMHTFVKPFYDSILHFADTLQISEVFFELVAIWSHTLKSIIVANVLLIWQLFEEARLPCYRGCVDDAHKRHDRHRDLNVVFCTDWCNWDRVGAHVARPVELPLLLVHPLPAGLPRSEAIELIRDVL